jgi:hypothetical protein
VLVGGLMSYIYNGFSLQKKCVIGMDHCCLWVAAMLIWLPVAAVLYLRSRSDLDKQSFRQRNFFKIFNTAFCCVHLLAAVGLLIAAFATALYFSFNNAANMTWSQLLVTHSLPVVLASMVHVFVAMAFFTPHQNETIFIGLFWPLLSIDTCYAFCSFGGTWIGKTR